MRIKKEAHPFLSHFGSWSACWLAASGLSPCKASSVPRVRLMSRSRHTPSQGPTGLIPRRFFEFTAVGASAAKDPRRKEWRSFFGECLMRAMAQDGPLYVKNVGGDLMELGEGDEVPCRHSSPPPPTCLGIATEFFGFPA